jgi:hypothetical protein
MSRDTLAIRSAMVRNPSVAAFALVVLIALVGFWPTYFGRLIPWTADETGLTHAHAAVQVAWLALFGTQVALAATGRIAQHRRLGAWVMGYAVVVACVGVAIAFETAGRQVVAGDIARGQRFLFNFLREVVFFAAFVAAGWVYRARPHVHKRLMIVAATMAVVPAVGRMRFLGVPPSLGDFMLVWPLPVYVAMAHDYVTKRSVHPAYVVGVLAMLAERLVLPLGRSDTWTRLSSWFVPFYQ